MKKILILIMSCNHPFFEKQFNFAKDTWLKEVGNFDNIDYCLYSSSETGKFYINKKKHIIKVPCDDSIFGTYDKTIKTLTLIEQENIYDYDYIFRTNGSTYINISLLNEFIQNLKDEDWNKVYAPKIYLTQEQGPYKYGLFAQGNGLILHRNMIDVIKPNKLEDYLERYPLEVKDNNLNCGLVDDGSIGYMLCCYYCDNGYDIFDMFNSFGCYSNKKLFTRQDEYDVPFDKIICISFRDYDNPDRHEEFDRGIYIYDKLKDLHNCSDLSLVYEHLDKEIVGLNIPQFMNKDISKQEALNILKYNDSFIKIPNINFKRNGKERKERL